MPVNSRDVNRLSVVPAMDHSLRNDLIVRTTKTTTALFFTALSLLTVSSLRAGSGAASMHVSVQVMARAVVTVDSQPATVDVTADDISRGYVDVAAPIVVRVRTNSRAGYMLQVENSSETFASIELSTAGASLNVASQEAWIQRPYVAGGDRMPMSARLRLAPNASAGSYALPITFSASPL